MIKKREILMHLFLMNFEITNTMWFFFSTKTKVCKLRFSICFSAENYLCQKSTWNWPLIYLANCILKTFAWYFFLPSHFRSFFDFLTNTRLNWKKNFYDVAMDKEKVQMFNFIIIISNFNICALNLFWNCYFKDRSWNFHVFLFF